MLKKTALISFMLIYTAFSFCQNRKSSAIDSVFNNIVKQIILFPQEKIYLQTDKEVYISGEKIWFRAYLVDASLHRPVINQYVYVELINPSDIVVRRVLIRQNKGAYSGYLQIDQLSPEGEYTLCTWSDNMLNTGMDFFYKKKIRIASPLSSTIAIESKFSFKNNGEVMTELSFEDFVTRKKLNPEGLRISLNNQPVTGYNFKMYDGVYFSFKLPDKNKNNSLYVETTKARKYIPVQVPDDDYEVTFYPEGGNLLNGVPCKVAFKALKSNGLPVRITGNVFDNNGNVLATINTKHDGMGSFFLVSKTGRSCFALCRTDQGTERQFKLPDIQKGLYSLKAEIVRNQLYVTVLKSSDVTESKELYLVLHTRGMVFYASPWDNNLRVLSFNLEKFPSGVLQIILFDTKMNPLSERLVFYNNNDQARIDVETDLQTYKPRQKVTSTVKVTDNKGNQREGSFSVAVTDNNDVKPDTLSNIMTSMLLTSELKGNINNPMYYFDEKNPEASIALDLLMLTNGWRRYNIPEAIAGRYDKPKIPLKNGMQITGMVRRLIPAKPFEKSKVSISAWASDYYDETITNKDGRFIFKGLEFQDSIKFVVQAFNKLGGNRVELLVDADSFPKVSGIPADYSSEIHDGESDKQLSGYMAKADKKNMIENGIKVIDLPEVFVTAKATYPKDYNYSFYMPKLSSNVMSSRQIESYNPTRVSEILMHFPGVRIMEDESGRMKAIIDRMSLRMTGPVYNFAALIIDDMQIDDYDLDNEIDPANIEKIGLLKGSQATLLGGAGSGGAIVISTKKGNYAANNTPKFNIKILYPLGYQKPAEFYAPRYDTQEQKKSWTPDMRTTIYWNPNVTISSSGEASFDFYTADASTTYSMIIEGITNDGSIIRTVRKLSVK